MTIGAIICLVIGIILVIAGLSIGGYFIYDTEVGAGITCIISGIIIGGCFIVGSLIYSNSETGKRALKDQQSNFGNGISRTVTVYDLNGKIIKEYTGKFDIETDKESYILFDDENGKRHIIYYTTGTITVDEN